MGNIIVLDEITANKIAAGEVVERPASVVKELVENSLDAGSSRIEISISEGGLKNITVTDNGSGMDDQDAITAFARHATSKISGAEDLVSILTLGFRGEALPSIAAISQLELKTNRASTSVGTKVVVKGGHILQKQEVGCPKGTSIRVNDIFFNTPARLKYLKGQTVEAGHVSDVVSKLALGCPDVSFQLTSNNRSVLKTSGNGNILDCIANIYGAGTAREMLQVDESLDGMTVTGYIGKPSLSRSGRTHQIIFVNGRYVKSRIISEAVERAYHSLMMIGRHPVFVLNIGIRPELVDVNVHPAKTEVRVAMARQLGDYICSAITMVLARNRLIPEAVSKTGVGVLERASKLQVPEIQQEAWNMPSKQSIQVPIVRDTAKSSTQLPEDGLLKETSSVEYLKEIPSKPNKIDTIENNAVIDAPETIAADHQFPQLQPIGQIDCTYIVAQGLNGMYLIDQHAAHERILFEQFMVMPEEQTSIQLLFPETLELTHHEVNILTDNINTLTDIGFTIEHFGGKSFLLRGVPGGMGKSGIKEIFLDLLDYFSHNRCTITGKELREKLLISMACKGAIKAHHKLEMAEMESLIEQLSTVPHPYNCPHGRPTLIHFSGYDLEKKFKRVL